MHAPSEEKSDDSKERFYEELDRGFDYFPKYHMKILLGDFNVKVRRENIFKPTIGNESLHQDSNDNGVRIVRFVTSKNLVVKSWMFPHRHIHKYTWTSPDGKTDKQIDHVLIEKKWYSRVLDVRSFMGADCETDHYLVVAKFRERLAESTQAVQSFDGERFNLRKLNELEFRKQYYIQITNRFAALDNLSDYKDINKAWENIKENIKTSAKESIGMQELKQHKPGFNEECLGLLDQRKQAKLQWAHDPSQSNIDNPDNVRRDANRHFRNKQKAYLKAKIEELETISKIKNIRDLHRDINDIKKGYHPRTNIVKDDKGDLVADSHSILARCKNYFSQILNVHEVNNVRQREIHTAEPLVPDPSAPEVELAIEKLKSHKLPGIDQIPAEVVKTVGKAIRCEIHKLFISIWNKEE